MKNSDRGNRFEQQFVKNSKNFFNLPLNGKILQGKVVLKGTVTLGAGGGANGVKKGEGGPINLIKRITVTVTAASGSRYPSGKVVDCDARSLVRYAMFQRAKFIGELSGSTLGDGAAGAYDIYLSIPIYFADPNFKRQVETALNADPSAYQSITVQVDTGSITDCFTGNTRTEDYSALHVQWVDDRENFDGDTYCLFQESHNYIINAAEARALDKAMPQDGAFLQWLIMTENTAALTLADTILNRITLAGDALDYDKYADDIRQQMFDDCWLDAAAGATGLYFIDFTDGMLSGSVAAQTLNAKFDLANPGGAGVDDLLVYTRRIFAPAQYNSVRGAKASQNS